MIQISPIAQHKEFFAAKATAKKKTATTKKKVANNKAKAKTKTTKAKKTKTAALANRDHKLATSIFPIQGKAGIAIRDGVLGPNHFYIYGGEQTGWVDVFDSPHRDVKNFPFPNKRLIAVQTRSNPSNTDPRKLQYYFLDPKGTEMVNGVQLFHREATDADFAIFGAPRLSTQPLEFPLSDKLKGLSISRSEDGTQLSIRRGDGYVGDVAVYNSMSETFNPILVLSDLGRDRTGRKEQLPDLPRAGKGQKGKNLIIRAQKQRYTTLYFCIFHDTDRDGIPIIKVEEVKEPKPQDDAERTNQRHLRLSGADNFGGQVLNRGFDGIN